MNKTKKILAIIGTILLLSMYGIAFIASLFNGDLAFKIFQAAFVCTCSVPIFLYGIILFYKLFHQNK